MRPVVDDLLCVRIGDLHIAPDEHRGPYYLRIGDQHVLVEVNTLAPVPYVRLAAEQADECIALTSMEQPCYGGRKHYFVHNGRRSLKMWCAGDRWVSHATERLSHRVWHLSLRKRAQYRRERITAKLKQYYARPPIRRQMQLEGQLEMLSRK